MSSNGADKFLVADPSFSRESYFQLAQEWQILDFPNQDVDDWNGAPASAVTAVRQTRDASVIQNLWPKFMSEDPSVFIAYAPRLFQLLRQCFRIEELSFAKALSASRDVEKHHFSEGASGSFFYLTENAEYMVKTLTEEEYRLLLRILPAYVLHMQKYPDSLICRFFGLYSVQMYGHTGT